MKNRNDRGKNIALVNSDRAFEKRLEENAKRRDMAMATKRREPRCKTVSFLTTLSLYEKIKANALCEGRSMGEYINNILEEAIGGKNNDV